MSMKEFHAWAAHYQEKNKRVIQNNFGMAPHFNVVPNAHQTYGKEGQAFSTKGTEFLKFGVNKQDEENQYIKEFWSGLSPETIKSIPPYLRGKKTGKEEGFKIGKKEGIAQANRDYRGDVKVTRDVMPVSSVTGRLPLVQPWSTTKLPKVTSLKAKKSTPEKKLDPTAAAKSAIRYHSASAQSLSRAMSKRDRNPLSRYFA